MATLKQTLENHFFPFIKENGLESLQDKFIEVLTKCEYELDDVIEKLVDDEINNACVEVEHENTHLHEMIDGLEDDYKRLEDECSDLKEKTDFFVPKTLEDEFKIQWIKDNWDKIPSI